jgi:hypothetical protein
MELLIRTLGRDEADLLDDVVARLDAQPVSAFPQPGPGPGE